MEQDLLLLAAGAVIGFLLRSAFVSPGRYEKAVGHAEGLHEGFITAFAVLAVNKAAKAPEKPVDTDTPAFIRKGRQIGSKTSVEGIK